MLKKIRLTDFKSFVDEEVELSPLTLLVGANASGKSNFLDAIRFLQGLSLDLTLSEVLDGEEKTGSDRWTGIRGRREEAARFGSSNFAIESAWSLPHLQEQIQHQIACDVHPVPVVTRESFHWGDREKVFASSFRGRPEIRHQTKKGQLRRSYFFSPWKSRLGDPKTRLTLGDLEGFEVLEKLQEVFSSIRAVEIKPPQMRDYGRRGAPLGNDGKNFSGVLASLSEDEQMKHSFVVWLREICSPEIEDLDFAEIKELGDVMAIFVEKGGARISARSISDGTLHFLGTLLALQTAEPGEILLIEELEDGLHPTRIHFLLELLESAVRQRGIQVIATTHSPVVLQWLAPERLREVIVFGRVPDHKGTIMRRLGDLPHFEEVIQREGIDELFSTGWLEMAL